MEQKSTIYTYGNEWMRTDELIRLLVPYGINCVVDCRPATNTPMGSNASSMDLQKILKCHNIFYLNFHDHFGHFPQVVTDKRGNIVYEKAIKTDSFLKGIERIRNGIKKGFAICIIDDKQNTSKSTRFTLIGHFLKDTCHVLHIYLNGGKISQEELEHRINENNLKRKYNKDKAIKIGQTGEELAGLYLIRAGFHILDRNWNLHKGCELDIIAMKDNKLHFIEVKTRSSDKHGEPQLAIDKKKMRHITKAIHEYRYRRHLFNMDYQIDSIAIIYRTEEDYELRHFPDIRPNYYTTNYSLPYKNH